MCNIVTVTPSNTLALESGNNQVLLSCTHSLLGLEVSELSSVEVSRGTTLLEEHSSLGSSVSRESSTAGLLNSSLSSSMGLDTRETSSGSNVAPDNLLLGTDHISSPGNIRNSKEACGGVTVGIVGAGSSCEACRELGSSQGRGGEGENKEKHLEKKI